MVPGLKTVLRRAGGSAAAALVFVLAFSPAASSQGILDALFGFRPPQTPVYVPRITAYAEPAPPVSLGASSSPLPVPDAKLSGDMAGPVVAYCVRLCDGRYFPLARSAAISPADLCRSFCPSARTRIYVGPDINRATAVDGSRYANLDTALLYRTRLVENCTCNGRDAFGVARMSIARDATLRAGDLVARDGGFVAFTGFRPSTRTAAFTPVGQYPNVSADVRRKLSETKVLPTQAPAPLLLPLTAEDRSSWRDDRSAQLSR